MKSTKQQRYSNNSAIYEEEQLGYAKELLQRHRTPSLRNDTQRIIQKMTFLEVIS